MSYKIVRIRGVTAASRSQRLDATGHWMAELGWRLVDFSESSHQAMFEPASESALAVPVWKLPPLFWQGVWEEWRTPWRLVPAGGVFLLLILLFAFNATQSDFDPREAAREEQGRWRRVTVSTLNVREAPNGGAQIVGMVYQNQRVMVGEEMENWVELVEPHRGFVSARFLERVVPEESPAEDD